MPDEPITRYPDEPHPDNEYEWKRWFVKLFYRVEDDVNVAWLNQCWMETKARWCVQVKFDEGYALVKMKI